ncbi:MAG: SRPBCC domain-containing protein [Fimbriimonadaceae bacterium]|nr:SRPBCC domain-containing protein [Fimbriimonadaceae bacterium]
MKVEIKSQNPITDEACKAATGKTMQEWYAEIEAKGLESQGRREINNYLYADCKVEAWWAGTLSVSYEEHKGKKEKDGRLKGYFICSTKTINAPVDAVYKAWTDSSLLGKWIGSGAKVDPKEGGSLDDGDGNKGTFKRVRENKDLRFSWHTAGGDESLVDVVLTDKGGKTGLLVNHDRIQTRAEADGIREAWSTSLTTLKDILEKGS